MAVPESSVTEVASAREPNAKKSRVKCDKATIAKAQDIKYAKFLAGNEKTTRDRALKSLRKWFEQRSISMPFTEDDLMLLWKGLFYSMWMSDKLLIQEECAENISQLIHSLSGDAQMLFFKVALLTLCNEWFGIDQLRLDKFLTLVRRLLRQALEVLKRLNWSIKNMRQFQSALSGSVLSTEKKAPLGLTMHLTDIYMEEVAKVSEGKLNPGILLEILDPFAKYLSCATDNRLSASIAKNIFRYLLVQSDAGLDYVDKFNAWKEMGCPGGSIDAMEREVSDEATASGGSEDEIEEEKSKGALDPRAGRVNVELPQLKFSSKLIVNLLNKHKFHKSSNAKSRKLTTKLITEFTEMSRGDYPLGVKTVDKVVDDGYSTKIKHAVSRLTKFEKKLHSKNGKKRKHEVVKEDEEVQHDESVPKKVKADKKVPKVKTNDKSNDQLVAKQMRTSSKRKQSNPLLEMATKRSKPGNQSMNQSTIDRIYDNFESSFDHNSGTWFVYNGGVDNSTLATPKPEVANGSPKKACPAKKNCAIQFTPEESSTPTKKPFQQATEWDVPLQDGETEIFVPANKYKKKHPNNQLLAISMNQIRGKNRRSLDPRMIARDSPKKVKIDLRLNKSQEIHEHVAQLKSSPAIPFDANRKPSKPLLKPNAVASPINPFYKHKLHF